MSTTLQGQIKDDGSCQVHMIVGRPLSKSDQFAPVMEIEALIDTGAEMSGLDQRVVDALGIKAHGEAQLDTATASESAPTVLVQSCFREAPRVAVGCRVSEMFTFSKRGVFMVLGLDILRECVLTIDWPARRWTLVVPDKGSA